MPDLDDVVVGPSFTGPDYTMLQCPGCRAYLSNVTRIFDGEPPAPTPMELVQCPFCGFRGEFDICSGDYRNPAYKQGTAVAAPDAQQRVREARAIAGVAGALAVSGAFVRADPNREEPEWPRQCAAVIAGAVIVAGEEIVRTIRGMRWQPRPPRGARRRAKHQPPEDDGASQVRFT